MLENKMDGLMILIHLAVKNSVKYRALSGLY